MLAIRCRYGGRCTFICYGRDLGHRPADPVAARKWEGNEIVRSMVTHAYNITRDASADYHGWDSRHECNKRLLHSTWRAAEEQQLRVRLMAAYHGMHPFSREQLELGVPAMAPRNLFGLLRNVSYTVTYSELAVLEYDPEYVLAELAMRASSADAAARLNLYRCFIDAPVRRDEARRALITANLPVPEQPECNWVQGSAGGSFSAGIGIASPRAPLGSAASEPSTLTTHRRMRPRDQNES